MAFITLKDKQYYEYLKVFRKFNYFLTAKIMLAYDN